MSTCFLDVGILAPLRPRIYIYIYMYIMENVKVCNRNRYWRRRRIRRNKGGSSAKFSRYHRAKRNANVNINITTSSNSTVASYEPIYDAKGFGNFGRLTCEFDDDEVRSSIYSSGCFGDGGGRGFGYDRYERQDITYTALSPPTTSQKVDANEDSCNINSFINSNSNTLILHPSIPSISPCVYIRA